MAQILVPNQLTNPPDAPTLTPGTGGNLDDGTYTYKISFVMPSGESLPSNPAIVDSGGPSASIALSDISLGPSYVTARKIYRTEVDSSPLMYAGAINDNTTTTYLDTLADSELTYAPFTSSNIIDPRLDINGILNIVGFVQQKTASASVAYTSLPGTSPVCNGSACLITITGLTTAAQVSQICTVFNNYVTPSSSIVATINEYTGILVDDGIPMITIGSIASGQFVINIVNAVPATAALTGNLIIFCQVIN